RGSSSPGRHVPSIAELQDLVEAHGKAAGRAAAGGVDGLELHSHESFLHASMLNPVWNTRTDEYGGPLENRMRFLVETLKAMRAAIGREMPLGVRLKADDIEQRGMGPAEYRQVLRLLEEQALVDYVNLTGGDGRFHHGPSPRPEGEWIPLVKEVRGDSRLVIMHAGRITTPEMAEDAVRSGAVDVVCMTKTHIADPHFVRKVRENRVEDIRFCTRCLQSCHGKMDKMTCVYNPVTSREAAWAVLEPAASRRRIVVVGAGPAGMEAAITAAQRGHQVIVLEQSDRVGGQVLVAGGSPLRQPFTRIAEFYDRQSKKGLIELRLGVQATADMIEDLSPDVVVVATGSRPLRASIPGDRPGEQPGVEILTVHEAITGPARNGTRALILDREGFNRPLVAADSLSSRGVQVDFVTPMLSVSPAVEGMMLDEMIHRLTERGVRFWPGQEVAEWNGRTGAILIRDVQTGEEREHGRFDAVIGAVGSEPVNGLATTLRGRVPELHVIGDANVPATVEAATFQGGRIGRLV
ncbi:MAG: FAD-dependent oxidoreductase, partial [Chloroflexi bacterium]|nr:FAD-dependent oxidoreductase [Chloroflexota bacterium]